MANGHAIGRVLECVQCTIHFHPIVSVDFPGGIHSKLNFGLPQPPTNTDGVGGAQIAAQNEQFPPSPRRQFC
jgi:hypothetical protein